LGNTTYKLELLRTGLILGVLFGAICYLIWEGIIVGILAFIITLTLYFLIKEYYPKWLKRKKEALIEKDLPYFINSIAQELSLGIPFDNALKNLIKESSGGLKKELLGIHKRIDSGKGIAESIQISYAKFESSQIKRTLSYLIYIYEQGNKTVRDIEPLKNLEKEFLIKQRNELKKFNARISVISLFIIVFSTIIPAMFQAFVIVGSFFIELNMTKEQIFLIIVLLFPAINLGILLGVNEISPAILKG